ncbi:hypothetical protein [Streptococcus suis]|uniref:hypothetical protein n=1 Tax=Streptococcus suis TaxID=1307 RepID=UPI00300FF36A
MDYRFIKGSSPRILVFFHGTGGDKESVLFLRQQLDLEASVLSLDGSWGQGRERRFFAPLIDGQLELVGFSGFLAGLRHPALPADYLCWLFKRCQLYHGFVDQTAKSGGQLYLAPPFGLRLCFSFGK